MTRRYFFFGIFYLLSIIVATPTIIPWWYRVSFWLFAAFLLWMSAYLGRARPEMSPRWARIFLVYTLGLLFATRIIPFLHWGEAPLGYDAGIYLRNFELYLQDPQEAVRPLGLVVNMLAAAGLSTNAILHFFLIVLNVLLGCSLYTVAKTLFRNQLIALSTLLVFTLSIAQYEAYVWMFYRMMLSLVLFMVTFTLIARRSYLAVVTGAFAGAMHPATFIVFGSTYTIFTIAEGVRAAMSRAWIKPFRFTVITGAAMLLLAVLVNIPEFHFELPTLIQHKLSIASISSFHPYLSNELTGFYLNFTGFRLSTLFYVPFALLGFVLLVTRARSWWNTGQAHGILFFLSFVMVTASLIVAKVIFYQRYFIILDLLVILFAAITLARLVYYFQSARGGQLLLAIFVVGFSVVMLLYSWTRAPWILPSELRELKAITPFLEGNAYGMATDSFYTPWVYGYVTTRTIAPGYFMNAWSYEEWRRFWDQGTDKERQELLARYGDSPLYIFVGAKQDDHKPMRQFLEIYGTPVSPHIWRYQSAVQR